MLELSLHILDVLENSIEAGATRITLSIQEQVKEDRLTIMVRDNGPGMSEEMAQKAVDPFVTTRTTRHVGLGLPLFAAAAERCNGRLWIEAKPGEGTTVVATFQNSHIDRPPLGNLPATIMAAVLSEQLVDVSYKHTVDGRTFELDTAEIRRGLEPVPLSAPRARQWLESKLQEGLVGLQRPFP